MPFQGRPRVRLRCAYCDKGFDRYLSQIKSSRVFCSVLCQRRGTVEQRKRFKKIKTDYRKAAFKAYGRACQQCGYHKFARLLWVHHKNFKPRDRQDNHSLENLEVLCIRCHQELHLGAKYAFC